MRKKGKGVEISTEKENSPRNRKLGKFLIGALASDFYEIYQLKDRKNPGRVLEKLLPIECSNRKYSKRRGNRTGIQSHPYLAV